MSQPLQILIVEDHDVMRYMVRCMLNSQEDLQVAGEAATGQDALKLCEEKVFDIVLLDLRLPDLSGIDIARQLIRENYEGKIIVLSMRNEAEVRQSLPEGIPFVGKHEASDKLLEVIRTVGNGRSNV